MSKLNVKTGDCALCSKKEVDTIWADCHVPYLGEWINQSEPVCFDCAAKRVLKKEVETHAVKKVEVKGTAKPKPLPNKSLKEGRLSTEEEAMVIHPAIPTAKYPKEETVAANYSKPKKAY